MPSPECRVIPLLGCLSRRVCILQREESIGACLLWRVGLLYDARFKSVLSPCLHHLAEIGCLEHERLSRACDANKHMRMSTREHDCNVALQRALYCLANAVDKICGLGEPPLLQH
jgi:hypothetical protein